MVVAGASAGFTLAFLTLFEPGDRIGVTRARISVLSQRAAGTGNGAGAGRSRSRDPVGTDAEPSRCGGRISTVWCSRHRRTRPARCCAPMRFTQITAACGARGIAVIADEIYHGIVDGAAGTTVLDHDDDAFVVNSFSKYWSMTGWRVGWLVVPDSLVDIGRAAATESVHLRAARVAGRSTGGPRCNRRTRRSRRAIPENRRILIDGLASAGITDHRARGRGVLRVRPCAASDDGDRHRLARPHPALAPRARGRCDVGNRLRPRTRSRVRAVLVCGSDERHGRSLRTPRRMDAMTASPSGPDTKGPSTLPAGWMP